MANIAEAALRVLVATAEKPSGIRSGRRWPTRQQGPLWESRCQEYLTWLGNRRATAPEKA
jgi:hypothetical protein